MNLDELEIDKKQMKHKKQSTVVNDQVEQKNDDNIDDQNVEMAEIETITRKHHKRIVVFCTSISLLVGYVISFIVMIIVYNMTYTDVYSMLDYSEYTSLADNSLTFNDLYEDNEEKFYSLLTTGMNIPDMSLKDNNGDMYTLYELIDSDDRYIIEFVKPSCQYCEKMIDIIKQYGEQDGSYKVIVISMNDDDISKFNDNAYILADENTAVGNFINRLNWVPAFLFIENNTVNFVKYGDFSIEYMNEAVSLAFGK